MHVADGLFDVMIVAAGHHAEARTRPTEVRECRTWCGCEAGRWCRVWQETMMGCSRAKEEETGNAECKAMHHVGQIRP